MKTDLIRWKLRNWWGASRLGRAVHIFRNRPIMYRMKIMGTVVVNQNHTHIQECHIHASVGPSVKVVGSEE